MTVAWLILLCCVPVALGIYRLLRGVWSYLVRPLTERIPTGRQYRPGIHPQERKR